MPISVHDDTEFVYVTQSATSSQCKLSCKISVRPRSNFLVSLTTRAAADTLQSVSDRLRGSGKYDIALVNAGGHECVNKCGR